jgi:hypothetical protein
VLLVYWASEGREAEWLLAVDRHGTILHKCSVLCTRGNRLTHIYTERPQEKSDLFFDVSGTRLVTAC